MKQELKDIEQLEAAGLCEICGGGRNGANVFLSGAAGAAEGVLICAQAGIFIPYVYAACAAGGAVSGIIWPR